MLKERAFFCLLIFLMMFLISPRANAARQENNNYYNYHPKWLKSSHKAVQPQCYISLGMSYPTSIDITNRYKGDQNWNSDQFSGVALSKPKKKPFYTAAIGTRSSFNDQVAFEVEALLYKGRSNGNGVPGGVAKYLEFSYKMESFSMLINSYYIFNGYNGFHPFVGVGAGVSYNTLSDIVLTPQRSGGFPILSPRQYKDISKLAPAFQVVLGINKNITENIDIQAKVKAMSLGKFSDFDSEGRFRAVTISGDIGFKYSLNSLKRSRKHSKRDI